MALKIKETPILTGKAAEDFLQRLADQMAYLETPEGKEEARKERERLRTNYEKFKGMIKNSNEF